MTQRKHPSEWDVLDPPWFWPKHNLTILADRHKEDGTRQHVVLEPVVKGTMLDNAEILNWDHLEES